MHASHGTRMQASQLPLCIHGVPKITYGHAICTSQSIYIKINCLTFWHPKYQNCKPECALPCTTTTRPIAMRTASIGLWGWSYYNYKYSSGPFWTHIIKTKAKYISISNILHLLSTPASISPCRSSSSQFGYCFPKQL